MSGSSCALKEVKVQLHPQETNGEYNYAMLIRRFQVAVLPWASHYASLSLSCQEKELD